MQLFDAHEVKRHQRATRCCSKNAKNCFRCYGTSSFFAKCHRCPYHVLCCAGRHRAGAGAAAALVALAGAGAGLPSRRGCVRARGFAWGAGACVCSNARCSSSLAARCAFQQFTPAVPLPLNQLPPKEEISRTAGLSCARAISLPGARPPRHRGLSQAPTALLPARSRCQARIA